MSTIINVLIGTVVTIVIAYLAFEIVRLRNKVKERTNEFIQATMDKAILFEKLNEIIDANNKASLEKSDGFLKFVSDSRDWAFDYIEKTQEEIKKFSDTAGREIDYFETYGQAIESAHSESLRKIAAAYKQLIMLLPTEETKE